MRTSRVNTWKGGTMKRRIAAIVLALGAVGLAACGGEKKPAEPKTETSKPEEKKEEKARTEDAAERVKQAVSLREKVLQAYRTKQEKNGIKRANPKRMNLMAKTKPVEVKMTGGIENVEIHPKFQEELSDADKKLLNDRMFFMRRYVSPGDMQHKMEQLFEVYENNAYKYAPSFVTTDLMFHTFHIFYDFTLRKIEQEYLFQSMLDMTKECITSAKADYESLESEFKPLMIKRLALYETANRLLGGDKTALPDEVEKIVGKEVNRMNRAEGLAICGITGKEIDYSQFKPRGHYTRTDELKKYFKGMMLYGYVGIPLEKEKKPDRDAIRLAMLIAGDVIRHDTAFKSWNRVYDITEIFVGESDDIGIKEMNYIFEDVLKGKFDVNMLSDETVMKKIEDAIHKMPAPMIQAKLSESHPDMASSEKQFKLMGQRFLLDNAVLQQLMEPKTHPIVSGMDVMAALGSDTAYNLQIKLEDNDRWPKYVPIMKDLRQGIDSCKEEDWEANIYTGWLDALRYQVEPVNGMYPPFMLTDAWARKNLNTALGSWAEMKHDTVLYGKQPVAEFGGMGNPELPIGYVEPQVEVYERLQWMTQYAMDNLKAQNMFFEDLEYPMTTMNQLLENLARISKKELTGEAPDENDIRVIFEIGGTVEGLMANFADVRHWFDVTSETDRNMALVADFATILPGEAQGGILHAATGAPYEIYVVVPIDGKPVLTRGAVFRYYEFLDPKRWNDEEWQAELKKNEKLPYLYWQEDLFTER